MKTRAFTTLTTADFQRFHRFRITDDLIELHEIRRVTDAEARELGIHFKADLSGVVYPISGADDTIKGYRVRRDNPEIENGAPRGKYIQSVDRPHLFFERTSRRWLSDTSIDVMFVEACSSALAVASWCRRTSIGLLIVATGGCWGWRGTIGKRQNENGVRVDEKGPNPDLDHIPLQNRNAIIAFDANLNSNGKVQTACRAFVRELRSRGAGVRVAIIPEEVNVNGPDDYLECHTDDEFLSVIESANEPEDLAPTPAKKSQADKLVELAEGAEFFYQDIDEAFASLRVDDHIETCRVKSAGFRYWLSHEFYCQYKKAPSSEALQAALNVLAGRAIHEGKQISVHTRVAQRSGKLYLDLANEKWQAIEITSEGWRIIQDVPVKFIRTRGMLPIPEPIRGGNLDEVRQFVNIRDDDDLALIKAYLVSTLRPNRPFIFLVFIGEQGSGKTSQSRRMKSIVDPSKAEVRGLPRELRDLAISARNGWVLAFDNVSTIPAWISDALCSLSTGGGFSTRELYSDSDEKIFDYQRPVILNGIGDIVTRPDLLDRCIVLQLPVIPEDKRRQEEELDREFEWARPRILGALLDAAVTALKNHSSIRLKTLPRMADFATWAVAAEPAHARKLIFLDAYLGNRANLNQVAIDTSVIGPPILQTLNGQNRWSGLLAELLEVLNTKVPDSVRKSKSWPSIPRQLKAELNRLAPNLRQLGIEVTFGKRTNQGIPVELECRRKSSSPSSPSSPAFNTNDLPSDDGSADGFRPSSPSSPG